MVSMLHIGGTGVISAAVVRRAAALGHEVTVLNRGQSSVRPVPDEVEVLTADIRDPQSVRGALGQRSFDVVVDYIAYLPEQVEADAALFAGRTGQYVFISSASAYQTPPASLPVTEDTPLDNPFWEYSRNKIACEQRIPELFGNAWMVIRPSHTYDRTSLPLTGGWTVIDRMRRGLPVVVHGDGTSLWTITHTDDVAVGLAGLLGHPDALGEAFHITGPTAIPWNQIYGELARAAGVDQPQLVHVASETIAEIHPAWGPGLLGDKAHSMVFDNSKVAALVPEFAPTTSFAAGAAEMIDWYDADPARQRVDPEVDAVISRLCRVPTVAVAAD